METKKITRPVARLRLQEKKDELSAMVKIEAKNLKKFATKEELNRLKISLLDPSMADRCIYGMMCGHCDNGRAMELMAKCSPVMYVSRCNASSLRIEVYSKMKTPKKIVTGHFAVSRKNRSPIEIFITNQEDKNISQLINYLKGKTRTLKFAEF
jgi:hypothetical protein